MSPSHLPPVTSPYGTTTALPPLTAEDRALLLMVAAVGFTLFAIETGAGELAGSQALKADALAFLASGTQAAWEVWAPERAERLRSDARAIVDAVLVLAGSWTAITTLYQFLVHPVPDAGFVAGMGMLALAGNALVIWRLWAHRTEGDARLRAVWRSARIHAIGNAAVIVAAGLIALLTSAAPDLVLAGVLVALFLSAAIPPARDSLKAWRARRGQGTHQRTPKAPVTPGNEDSGP